MKCEICGKAFQDGYCCIIPSKNTLGRNLKVVIFGEAGSGKTYWATEGEGKKLLIDTEGGAIHIQKKHDFDRIHCQSWKQLNSILDYVSTQKKYDTVILDSVTVLYQRLKETAMELAEKKKKTEVENLTQKDWNYVKTRYKNLITKICNLECNVIITAWEKDLYEGSFENMRRVGTTLDTDKSTAYMYDVLINITKKNNKRSFNVLKDRTGQFEGIIENLKLSDFKNDNFDKTEIIEDIKIEDKSIIEKMTEYMTENSITKEEMRKIVTELNLPRIDEWTEREVRRIEVYFSVRKNVE